MLQNPLRFAKVVVARDAKVYPLRTLHIHPPPSVAIPIAADSTLAAQLRNEPAEAVRESLLSKIISIAQRLMRPRVEIERQNNIPPL
jgi:hypothetical protein